VGRAAGRVGGMGLTPEQIRAWVEQSCAAQGIPVAVEDPRVIGRLVDLLAQSSRQTARTRAGSKVERPRTAGPTTARSSIAETTAR
jgi:hypothetical protein